MYQYCARRDRSKPHFYYFAAAIIYALQTAQHFRIVSIVEHCIISIVVSNFFLNKKIVSCGSISFLITDIPGPRTWPFMEHKCMCGTQM